MTVADVYLWGIHIGSVYWDPSKNSSVFEKKPGVNIDFAPIIMPLDSHKKIYDSSLVRNIEGLSGLHGLLSDSLPDKYGNKLMNQWARENGKGKLNPVERLLFIGDRGMGALEFKPSIDWAPEITESLEIEELVKYVAKIKDKHGNFIETDIKNNRESFNRLVSIGTSAGGARPKAIVGWDKSNDTFYSGRVDLPEGAEHWIIKFDESNNEYGKIEMAYYLMALRCGIKMEESRLHEAQGKQHFMTRRFDRGENNKKHHIQTLNGMAHFNWTPGKHSYEDVFNILRKLNLGYDDREQLYRRMLFNIMSINCDDHTKNFSFILKEHMKWELAPAYDLTYSYNHKNSWVCNQSLSVNSKRDNINLNDVLKLGRDNDIKNPEVIIRQVGREIYRCWIKHAKAAGLSSTIASEIQDHINKIQYTMKADY